MKKFDVNDPLLTAFALGELEGQEAIEMAKLIENDPEAKKYVEDIQQTANQISLELEKSAQEEAPLRLLPDERNVIFEKIVAKRTTWRPWILLAPAGGLAVAVIAFIVALPHIENFKRETFTPIATNESNDETRLGGLQKGEPQQVSEAKADASAGSEPIAASAPPPPPAKMQAVAALDIAEEEAMLEEAPAERPAAAPKQMQSKGRDSSKAGRLSDFDGSGLGAASSEIAGLADSTTTSSGYAGVEKKVAPRGRGAEGFGGGSAFISPGLQQQPARPERNTERYSAIKENGFKKVADEALSTFSIDVDTASYSNVRRYLTGGQLPPADAVRIEEMINYFKYDYPQPKGNEPFSVTTEVTTAPWAPKNKLVRIGLKGKDVAEAKRPASNLVFLLDVSGSMEDPAKLPLLKSSLKLLVDRLREKDRVGIVVYAGSEGIALESTPGTKKAKILEALDKLQAGGSTNGEAGIQAAYKMAEKNFIKGGVNRVILATDGDFNVGTTSEGELERLIEQKAKTGVFLTTLGFGSGNYNDSMMTKLAGKGNGNAAYIDTLKEAQKVLVEQAGGTLQTIAKDVKIQVEFNPKHVQAYRLIGYEKRMLNKEDFNDDKKDAGEIGAGHTVTALYEIVPPGAEIPNTAPKVDELKYQKNEAAKPTAEAPVTGTDELLTVKLRFKKPDGKTSDKIEVPVGNETKDFAASSSDMKFAAAVAGFGMILRDSELKGTVTLDDVIELTAGNSKVAGKMDDTRLELIELARKTRELQRKPKR
ncbi:MAG: von Willebrand factor type A domain-containing protein [Bdellovibrionota bacterium]